MKILRLKAQIENGIWLKEQGSKIFLIKVYLDYILNLKDIDIKELSKDEKSKLKTSDFPTTIFYKNNRITRQEVGTRLYIVVLRWIDVDFK